METEIGVASSQRNAGNRQKLGEERDGVSPELLGGVQACQCLDFVCLTSRIYISVVLSYRVCGNFLQQPQVTNTVAPQFSETCLLFCLPRTLMLRGVMLGH